MKHVIFKADAQDPEQMQLDLAEIKEHLGIPPSDSITEQELSDARKLRTSPQV